jgi:riboflavin biosynthesis pyrimidine reductase
VLVEGGALTLSRFLAAGCLHRLHILMAPLIIGAGPTGLSLPAIDRLDDALRPPAHACRLDQDMLFDLDLAPAVDG